MANRPARIVADDDRRRIWRTLEVHAAAGQVAALRDHALFVLAITTGLRVEELELLDVEQLVEDPRAKAQIRIVSELDLRADQAKLGRAATLPVVKSARDAIRTYLLAFRRKGWIETWRGPLWLQWRGPQAGAHVRLRKRTIQSAWTAWQRRAGIADPYRFHDLRHTAITAWAEKTENPFVLAELSRHRDLRTPMRYVHTNRTRLAELAEAAAGELERAARDQPRTARSSRNAGAAASSTRTHRGAIARRKSSRRGPK